MQSTSQQLRWSQKDGILLGYIINEYGFKHETPFEIHADQKADIFCAYESCQVSQIKKQLPIEPNNNLEDLKNFVQDYYLKQVQNEQEFCLLHDSLTRVYHRRYLREFLANQVQIAKLYNRQLSLIFIRINNLKYIIDCYGLRAGDSAVFSVAGLFQNSIRRCDILGRWSDEEFLILVPEQKLASAKIIADRITSTVKSSSFHSSENNDFLLSISTGVSCLDELDLKEPDDLLRLAEERIQKSKSEILESV